MSHRTPLFITASLLAAALALALPDFEIDAAAEEPVNTVKMARRTAIRDHDMAGARGAAAAEETPAPPGDRPRTE